MTALYIIGGVALLFVLIGLVPVGADVSYNAAGLLFKIKISFLRITLGGEKKPKKEKKPAKAKPEKKPAPDKPKKSLKLPLVKVILLLVKHAFSMLARIVSRFRVEVLRLYIVSALPDPADAALLYAAAGTGMDMLLNLGGDRLGKADLHADVDFDAAAPLVDFRMVLTIRIGAVLGAGLRFGFGFLKDYLKYKKEG